MGFITYLWKDRISQYPTRRTLTDVNTQETSVVEVSREEGVIYNKPSDDVPQFNAEIMNDIEHRLDEAFQAVFTKMGQRLNDFYPVGSIYISTDNTSPATIFGGTWQSISGGILLPSNNCNLTPQGSDTSSYVAQGTVNASAAAQKSFANLPQHTHYVSDRTGHNFMSIDEIERWSSGSEVNGTLTARASNTSTSGPIPADGKGHTHNVTIAAAFNSNKTVSTFNTMLPSITVYAWQRTA